MDLEQQLRAALAASKPDARVRAAVMARVSDAAKRAPGKSRNRILFGTILVALAAAAMLATYLLNSQPSPAIASVTSPEKVEPVVAVAEKPAEPVIEPVKQASAQDVAAPEKEKPLPLLLPPKQRTVPAQPNSAVVERALVARYPELVNGPEINSGTTVSITLKADGSVLKSAISQPGQGGDSRSTSTDLVALITSGGSRSTRMLQKGSAIADGAVLRGNVVLTAILLPEGYDEKRTVDLVQKALVSAHPELLLPMAAETFNQVTVFMTDDGKIDKYYVKNGPQGNLRPYGDIVPEKFASQWEPLGLKPEQLGLMGITNITERPATPVAAAPDGAMASILSRALSESRARAEAGATGATAPIAPRAPDPAELEAVRREVASFSASTKWMVVRYAWPRREGEPIGGYKASVQPTSLSSGGASFSHGEAAAVIDHHLPGALTDTGTVAMGRPWLLMNRKGEVVRSGYLPVSREYQRIDAQFMEKQVTDLRIGEVLQMTIVKKYGVAFVNEMIFAWVAPDAAGN